MPKRALEILLVEDDADLADMIVRHLHGAISSHVTHVTSADEAMREDLTCRHDVVLISMALPDDDGLALARALRPGSGCAVILMGEEPPSWQIIEALRMGVSDVLSKPFDMMELGESVERHAKRARRVRRERVRHRRLRRVTARIVCERRDLRQRMDLICRDFVHAYRRLAQKVTESSALVPEEQE